MTDTVTGRGDGGSVGRPSLRARGRAAPWVLALGLVQFLVCHVVVQNQWPTSYSWADNNISDLGNVGCGAWGPDERYVCSPWHDLMNVSFVALGAAILVGVLLMRRQVGISRAATVLLGMAAAGFVVAGLVPADVDEDIHVLLGAVSIFVAGNAGLVVTGLSRRFMQGARPLKAATALAGCVGLTAVVLFFLGADAGLGRGGTERFAALTMPAWLVLTAFLTPRHRTTE